MNLLRKPKKGNILTENLVFIILNVVFLSMLFIFLFLKSGDDSITEEVYAKKIALILDSARPSMSIYVNSEELVKRASSNKFGLDDVVVIKDNLVLVKLRDDGGYSYSFFNDVKVRSYQLYNNGVLQINLENE